MPKKSHKVRVHLTTALGATTAKWVYRADCGGCGWSDTKYMKEHAEAAARKHEKLKEVKGRG